MASPTQALGRRAEQDLSQLGLPAPTAQTIPTGTSEVTGQQEGDWRRSCHSSSSVLSPPFPRAGYCTKQRCDAIG